MIGSAIQFGEKVIIYDEKGWITGYCPAKDGLVGFTEKKVCVQSDGAIVVYDERGSYVSTHK